MCGTGRVYKRQAGACSITAARAVGGQRASLRRGPVQSGTLVDWLEEWSNEVVQEEREA